MRSLSCRSNWLKAKLQLRRLIISEKLNLSLSSHFKRKWRKNEKRLNYTSLLLSNLISRMMDWNSNLKTYRKRHRRELESPWKKWSQRTKWLSDIRKNQLSWSRQWKTKSRVNLLRCSRWFRLCRHRRKKKKINSMKNWSKVNQD
jgi:hypothetical protein